MLQKLYRESAEIVTTKEEMIQSPAALNTHKDLHPCSQKEANTKIILHAEDPSQAERTSVIIATVYTGAITGKIQSLTTRLGTGNNSEYFPIHFLLSKLGIERDTYLVFTSSNATSSLVSYGKTIHLGNIQKSHRYFRFCPSRLRLRFP